MANHRARRSSDRAVLVLPALRGAAIRLAIGAAPCLAIGVYFPGREKLRLIDSLDPVRDCQQIARLTYRYEFPLDHRRASRISLLRSFAIPSISQVLLDAGEFMQRTQKRYDDTDILLSHLIERGYDHPDGRLIIRKMNRMHRRFSIDNDQHRYILSTLVIEPLRWNRRFGFRPMSRNERVGFFTFWKEIGRRMAIADLFETVEDMEAWYEAYERRHMVFAECNRRLADHVLQAFLGKVHPRFRDVLLAPLDDRLLAAIGRPLPSPLLRQRVERAIRLSGRLSALLPKREPKDRHDRPRRTYPDGFALKDVGADPE